MVIIHGFTSNSAFWYLTIVPNLVRDFRMVTYDLRGHGKTDMPAKGYTSADMASDLHGLMEHLGMRKAHLIGHSFGGEIALQYAIRHPDRVNSVILADARVRALQPIQAIVKGPSWTEVRDKLTALGVELPKQKAEAGQVFFEELAASNWPGVWNPYSPQKQFGPFGLGRWGKRSVQQWVRLFCSTSAEDDLRSPAGVTEERLRRIQHRVLAVYGDRSGYLPTLGRLRRVLRNCETQIVPGVGHLLPVVVPGVFVRCVRGFIAGLNNGDSGSRQP